MSAECGMEGSNLGSATMNLDAEHQQLCLMQQVKNEGENPKPGNTLQEGTGTLGRTIDGESGDGILACHNTTPPPPPATTKKPRRPVKVIESPDWLPKGWVTELKTRGTGLSAGTKDKYFFDPVSNRRFRSRKEVFHFLETGKLGRYRPKCKKGDVGDVGGKSLAEKETGPCPVGGKAHRSEAADNASTLTLPLTPPQFCGGSHSTALSDLNKRPTKVRWVLNSSEGSWVPFVSEEEMNGSNGKEGELIFDLNCISADACGKDQLETAVIEDLNPSKGLQNESMEAGFDLNKPREGSPIVSPFGDSWPDPCLEFAVKTLTGALPVLDDNLALQNALQNYFSPQANAVEKLSNSSKSDSLGNEALVDCSGCNQQAEHTSSTEQRFPPSSKESNDFQNTLSASDSLPDRGTLNRYAYARKVKKFMRQRTKDLLEPLGRKLCKQALAFLRESRHPGLFFKKQPKRIPISFHMSQNFRIDCGHAEQSNLYSSYT